MEKVNGHKPSEVVANYIKATTSYGGDEYYKYSRFFTYDAMLEFEKWLQVQKPATKDRLFRGYCFDRGYWEDCFIKEGSTICEDQMTQAIELPAFTDDLLRASNYMNEFGEVGITDAVKVLFEIISPSKRFVDISAYSVYPEEREYRCKRDCLLLVEQVIPKGGFIVVKCKEL